MFVLFFFFRFLSEFHVAITISEIKKFIRFIYSSFFMINIYIYTCIHPCLVVIELRFAIAEHVDELRYALKHCH